MFLNHLYNACAVGFEQCSVCTFLIDRSSAFIRLIYNFKVVVSLQATLRCLLTHLSSDCDFISDVIHDVYIMTFVCFLP